MIANCFIKQGTEMFLHRRLKFRMGFHKPYCTLHSCEKFVNSLSYILTKLKAKICLSRYFVFRTAVVRENVVAPNNVIDEAISEIRVRLSSQIDPHFKQKLKEIL